MRYYSIILLSLLFVYSGCERTKDDLSGDCTLGGRLSYSDLLHTSNVQIPVSGVPISIAYHPSDTTNFIYSVNTDSSGYFLFTNLDKNKAYDIIFHDSVGGQWAFAFAGNLKPCNDTLNLQAIPDTNTQSVLLLSVLDNQASPVADASICLFNSLSLFLADSCQGSIDQLTTDSTGHAILYNLPKGTYYTRTSYRSDGIFLYAQDTVPTTATNITRFTVNLAQVTNINQLTIFVTTSDNEPVPNCPICVFNNNLLFMQDTCAGSILQLQTDITGKAMMTDMAAGTYYFFIQDSVGKARLSGTGSASLSASGDNTTYIIVNKN